MGLVNVIILNIYSVALLVVICYHSSTEKEKESLQYKLYTMMLRITIFMLVVDIFSRFDGKSDTMYAVINYLGNFLIFFLNPILPSLWLLYVHVNLFQDEKKTRQLVFPLVVYNAVNAALVVLSQFYGWYYYIDSNNIYHRGPLFLLAGSFTVVLILIVLIIIIANRRKIKKKHFFSLMFFCVPPLMCIILQVFFYGVSLMLNSVVLSQLVIFINIQNRDIYIDYLTGVNNRKMLDLHMMNKISASTGEKTFSAIMIDLDNFKNINDNYGHDEGDRALQNISTILKNCLRSNDFIARYGGDEFCIVLETSDRADLEEFICRVNESAKRYNAVSNLPYKIGFSMGFAIYDYHSHLKLDEFQKKIDTLLYENKQSHR